MLLLGIGITAATTFIVLLLVLEGRRREGSVVRQWELVLTPKGQQELRAAQERVQGPVELVDATYEQADAARKTGDLETARRLVAVGCRVIEEFSPTMVRALAAMAALSRMAAAIAPLPPLRPREFKLQQAANLAQFHRFLHHLVVTSAERFRFRVFVLQQGFGLLRRLAARWRSGEGHPAPPTWDALEALRHDFGVMSERSLESYRALLVSLAAEKKESEVRLHW